MAVTEIYVDPSIAGDSGAGTIGDPYGDLEYAIEQETFDTTNGTRVNIKAGTAEVLAANLDTALADTGTTAAWVPSDSAPLIFQGYTATAGDGGTGEISGGGSVPILDTSLDYIHFRDLKIGNVGANSVLNLDRYSSVVRCWLHTSSGDAARGHLQFVVSQCYFSDITGGSLTSVLSVESSGARFDYNHIISNSGAIGIGVRFGATAKFNIIECRHVESIGISVIDDASVEFNSIYSSASGTDNGITVAAAAEAVVVANNLIQGFSGSGGTGIEIAANSQVAYFHGNAVYDCETAISNSGDVVWASDNETLSATPFADAANGDFSPVDTGNVKEGALPQVIGGGFV